ncbi:glycosyltransferase [Planctomyces sp. SH-PL62]|uniref:glycosyltransferase n=1 Tax=Planctomyces sp. SH-PL62 TaxID=1636152 RepID=UPI00078EEF6D|nr:glycosyltransferase [Planctomyces sp. SH-PL62]AMV40024.1 UDP-Glc:alpha-D-GlcNAc-diphosphoundecaprenol beta-1,3-glucosyltransferase WfgD [Planctomyces sp. SH-PL62]
MTALPADPAPRLTVAVPTCNGEPHLAEALAGVLAQQGAMFDLLVCDDRSDDRTVDRVRELAGDRARIEINPERLGLAGNWNRAVTLSRTPWVAVFHQDDVMRPGDLASRLGAIERPGAESLGLIAGPADVIDQSGRPVPPEIVEYGGLAEPPTGRFVDFPPGAFASRLEASNLLRCSAVTTSKLAHEAVGGFDPSYRYVVDWDFWLRVADRFAVTWIAQEPKVSVRWHAASETHRFKVGLDDLEETERLLTRRSVRPGRRLARAYLNRAHDALRAGRVDLARTALDRAVAISPAVLTSILADPRLAAQMATLRLAPRLARRWFAR